jgi:hypothetical protein
MYCKKILLTLLFMYINLFFFIFQILIFLSILVKFHIVFSFSFKLKSFLSNKIQFSFSRFAKEMELRQNIGL